MPIMSLMSLRGFEKFIEGRPAEEVPRIVNRICGICPWMHHTAANKAVDSCFGVTPTPTGHKLRELLQVMAHINDKILHFFFLAAPDFVLGTGCRLFGAKCYGCGQGSPGAGNKVVKMRQLGQMMIDRFAGKAIHPIAAVVGGFSKPLPEAERQADVERYSGHCLIFSLFALDYAKNNVFSKYIDVIGELGVITTGFLGTVDRADGSFRLYDGMQRLMKADGTYVDFEGEDYLDYIGEHVEPWSYGKMPYAKSWDEGFSLDLDAPKGIYRANTLARINVCDQMSTPKAQEALEEFRSAFGRPAQATLLYHYARLIELVYACERTIELLNWEGITDTDVRAKVEPKAGQRRRDC